MYIYDTTNEVDNRMKALNSNNDEIDIDQNIIKGLIKIFDNENKIIKAFRMVRDHFEQLEFMLVQLQFLKKRHGDSLQYCPPSYFEICNLIVGDLGQFNHQHDIIIEHKIKGLYK